MNFLDLAKKRYSVRKFKDTKIKPVDINTILEAGRVAPSGANNQPYKLIVVQEEHGLEKIGKAANTYGAPLVIIVCGNHDTVWKRPYDGKDIVDIDTSIVTDHMMLQATDLGIGSVWICVFKPDVIKKEFELPDNLEPVSLLALGYADCEDQSPSRHDQTRHSLNELVCFEKLTA